MPSTRTFSTSTLFVLFCFTLCLAGPATLWAGDTAGVEPAAAFERLKEMAGTWHGVPGKDKEAEAHGPWLHEIEVSANGTVVMETMGPGSEHEMINMYHMDGDDLVLTHYCAGGNQPKMRLDAAASNTEALVFDFDGGTNLDPETDHYIHDAKIVFLEGGHIESHWQSFNAGEAGHTMRFTLAREGE